MASCKAKIPGLRTAIAALWKSLVMELLDPYRPELHYMRGPGPKWRAKHQAASPAHLSGTLAEASA